jgi:hypothetical protein
MAISTRFWLPFLALLAGLGLANAAWAEYLVEEAGLHFPDKLGSATQKRSVRYPQAALGHGIDYGASNFGASSFVYNGGERAIPDGIESSQARAEFAKARSQITGVQQRGGEAGPKLVRERIVKVGDISFMTAIYRYTRNNLDTLSVLALTGFRQHFVKLRIGMPAADEQAGMTQANEFLQGLAGLLANAGAR